MGDVSADRVLPLGPPGIVFLDRDGTINVKAPEGAYVRRPEEVVLLPGAAEAISMLNKAQLCVAVVTNQRGIALGRMTEQDLASVHERLRSLLDEATGARLDHVFHCPHAHGACACRKPATGMFRQAARRWPWVDFGRSVMIGDSASDVAAGQALGMTTIRIGVDARDLREAVSRLDLSP